ncbi:YqiA/YcfP family alpha/beta fold hydrolase [Pseudarthrobacter sp. J64]|uniref:YqiA/YcfP family alpha/beta fold hydrolase n=1 Tax=Pseudarthrobacter sp. J64 TaxID=3116485 RepID=UPI002E807070|nr:YqiA/YcfP family alpha/beta fold hydrolase [Pseudarthrobacter sp. J64]MEE2568482.1 YqiA/YcfP family alpha/beta fold hydrolase [Pseudarthrobacter sp. J64]
MNDHRFARFSDRVYLWSDVSTFISEADWCDGIHAVQLQDGSSLDVLIRGNLQKRASNTDTWPIFFNGAVDRSKGDPPFFSGSTLAAELDRPVISIADPTLAVGNDLGIGWYTGNPGSNAQEVIATLISALKRDLKEEIVLVGGSAGGFAALYFGVCTRTSAFVWNPQVDLLRYAPAYVRPYLSQVLSDGAWAGGVSEILRDTPEVDHALASRELHARGIEHVVGDTMSIPRLLYLQNQSDSHELRHARPLREREGFVAVDDGVYANGGRIMVVGHFAAGHRQPPREIIHKGLKAVLDVRSDLIKEAKDLLTHCEAVL